jgi:enoyl-CoA hydratase
MSAIHIKSPALTIKAGPRALARIRQNGLSPADVGILPGAAGGPKGIGIQGLDLALFGDWLLRAPREGKVVTVTEAACTAGAAVGAGMNLALCCDVRIAAHRAKFDTRFLQIGLHPGGGHTWMFQNIAGPQATMAAVVFGEILDGQEAQRVGLAYKCVPDDELISASRLMAVRAASAPRELAIITKRTIQEMANIATHSEAIAKELDPQVWTTRQPWFAERLAALQSRMKKS